MSARDLRELIEQHEELARFVSKRANVSREDAREAVQEAIARAAANVATIRCLHSWTATVALQVARDCKRHLQVVGAKRGYLWRGPDALTPECYVADAQELAKVSQLISELPPRQRRVFLLRRLEGLTAAEISARHGIPARTVRHHMAAARGYLEPRMRECGLLS